MFLVNWATFFNSDGGYMRINMLTRYATLLGQPVPTAGRAGGPSANGTYDGRRLLAATKIAFHEP